MDALIVDVIDESMLLPDMPTPCTSEIVSQGFGLAQPAEWMLVDVHNKALNALESFSVGSPPFEVVVMDSARPQHMPGELVSDLPNDDYGQGPRARHTPPRRPRHSGACQPRRGDADQDSTARAASP